MCAPSVVSSRCESRARWIFHLWGVLAKLTGALAGANVPVFVISTFETDVILIREVDQQRVVTALKFVAHIAPGMPGAI